MLNWIIHQVCDGQHMSFHTHGLNLYSSLELELNLLLVPKQAMQFINLIGMSIAEGKHYTSGERVDDIFTLPFYLLETSPIHGTFDGERVLRIIFCDPQMKYPWDAGCDLRYQAQLAESEIQEMRQLLGKGFFSAEGGLLS